MLGIYYVLLTVLTVLTFYISKCEHLIYQLNFKHNVLVLFFLGNFLPGTIPSPDPLNCCSPFLMHRHFSSSSSQKFHPHELDHLFPKSKDLQGMMPSMRAH